MGQALEVANRYFDTWQNKNGEGLGELLSEDFSFVGPIDQLDKAGMLEAVPKMGPILEKFHMRQQFEDGDNVCCIYDLDMVTPGGTMTIPMAEWLRVSNGKISQVRLFFDASKLAGQG